MYTKFGTESLLNFPLVRELGYFFSILYHVQHSQQILTLVSSRHHNNMITSGKVILNEVN